MGGSAVDPKGRIEATLRENLGLLEGRRKFHLILLGVRLKRCCCDTLAVDNSAKSTLKERDKMPEHKDQNSSNQGNVRLEIPRRERKRPKTNSQLSRKAQRKTSDSRDTE